MPTVDGPQESLLDPDFDASIHPMFNGSAEYSGPEEPEEPLRPLNWNLLSSEEAEAEWLDLNAGGLASLDLRSPADGDPALLASP